MRCTFTCALWPILLIGAVLALRPDGATVRAAPEETGKAPRIAVVSTLKITDELMNGPRFKPARTEFEDDLREREINPITERLKELQGRIEGMERDDPRFRDLREQYLRLQRELSEKTHELARAVERKVAEQLVECYALVRTSAAEVAENAGYTFVISSTDPDAKLETDTVVALTRDMLSRPVLVFPREVDITEDVRKELNLD